MNQLPYQNTQVISDYQAAPGLLSDATGALAAYQNFQSQQNQGTGDPTATTDASVEGPETIYEVDYTDASIDPSTGLPLEEEGNAAGGYIQGRAGGGYIGGSNLGILAPYHQRLIDGLYAGGRIHYQ